MAQVRLASNWKIQTVRSPVARLPVELLVYIFWLYQSDYFTCDDIRVLAMVSWSWRRIIMESKTLWRVIKITSRSTLRDVKRCITRSEGRMLDIIIQRHFLECYIEDTVNYLLKFKDHWRSFFCDAQRVDRTLAKLPRERFPFLKYICLHSHLEWFGSPQSTPALEYLEIRALYPKGLLNANRGLKTLVAYTTYFPLNALLQYQLLTTLKIRTITILSPSGVIRLPHLHFLALNTRESKKVFEAIEAPALKHLCFCVNSAGEMDDYFYQQLAKFSTVEHLYLGIQLVVDFCAITTHMQTLCHHFPNVCCFRFRTQCHFIEDGGLQTWLERGYPPKEIEMVGILRRRFQNARMVTTREFCECWL